MIVSIGNPSIDKIKIKETERLQPGGASVYSAVAASTLANSAIIGRVGNDYPFRFINALEKKGIDISNLRTMRRKSKNFEIVIDEKLESTYPRYDTSIDKYLIPADIPARLINKNNAFIITQMAPMKQLNFLKRIKEQADCLCLVNTHYYYIEKHRALFDKVIENADIFVLNQMEAQKLTNTYRTEISSKILSKYRDTMIIVTLGALGSVIIKNRETNFAPSIYNPTLVDPTGSGDSFSGSFLASYLTARDPIKSAIAGNVIASIKGEGWGFGKLLNLKFRKVEDIWDYVMTKNSLKGSQRVLLDF